MKTKLKPFLILLVTLLIGIAIGFEISEIMIKMRFDEMKAFREPKSFVNIFEDIIRPDKNQKTVIDSILLKYHVKMESVTKKGMSEVSGIMDSMKVELKPVLNQEQIKRLEAEFSRMKHFPPPRDRGMPPKDGAMQAPNGERQMPPPPRNGEMPPPDNRLLPPPHDFNR
jgi:hypothetical protein